MDRPRFGAEEARPESSEAVLAGAGLSIRREGSAGGSRRESRLSSRVECECGEGVPSRGESARVRTAPPRARRLPRCLNRHVLSSQGKGKRVLAPNQTEAFRGRAELAVVGAGQWLLTMGFLPALILSQYAVVDGVQPNFESPLDVRTPR